MEREKAGLQLYSVRADCAKDFPGTLSQVADMGYAAAEFAGFHGRGAEEIRKMLDERGLACCGSHTGMQLLGRDMLEETIDFNLALGNEFVIVPGLPEEMRGSLKAWKESARVLGELSERLKERGLRTGYHNHYIEFSPVEGEVPWDVLMGGTGSDVIMQIDTGNALRGGGKPEEYLKKYPRRAATVHLKEFSSSNDKAVIGEGDVNWREVFGLCREQGVTEWFIVEQESYAHPPLECVKKCLENLNSMDF